MTDKTASVAIPAFPRLDPATPAFWDVRFAAQFTPWDRGTIPDNLRQLLVSPSQARRNTLIPGCGAAREVGAFADAGWPVIAIDFSPTAVAIAQARLGDRAHLVRHGDFFDVGLTHDGFDMIYECAFMCALPPPLRAAWAAQVGRILPPGGILAGYFFFGAAPSGPPFGIRREELAALLAPNFTLREDLEPTDSIPVFRGLERWMVWQRNDTR